MKCTKCNREAYKIDLCKVHFHSRSKVYRYLGHIQTLVTEDSKIRKCLACDKEFEYYGNRRCNACNSSTGCHYESETSDFVRV